MAEPEPYDGQNRPCEVCGKPVVVTAIIGRVIHHRCVVRPPKGFYADPRIQAEIAAFHRFVERHRR